MGLEPELEFRTRIVTGLGIELGRGLGPGPGLWLWLCWDIPA